MNTTPNVAATKKDSSQDRRDNYRVDTPVQLRLRRVVEPVAVTGQFTPVAAFEELALAAARYRKELSNAGRAFVDRVVGTHECLTAAASTGDAVSQDWAAAREVVANVSAAGIGFDWPEEFSVGSMVEVEFSFAAGEGRGVPFTFSAEVRRSISRQGVWNIGLAFQDVTQVSQQRLIRQIYDVQRLDLRGRSEKS